MSVKGAVIATALVLLAGAIVYGLYTGVAALWHRQMLVRTIPAALDGVRKQREEMVQIIEQYKRHFGYYPPLFTPAGPDRGVLNPLCYELMGVRFDPKRKEFRISTSKDTLPVSLLLKDFHILAFSNSVEFPLVATNFVTDQSLTITPLTKETELFGIAISYTDFIPEPFWADYDFSAWRYATNPAQHNPGKFDLWVDISVAGRHFTVGNWPEVN